MKMGITADIHLYGDQRLPKIKKGLEYIFSKLIERGIENLVILGDVFHGKHLLHSAAVNYFREVIEKFREINITVIDGNHDISIIDGNLYSPNRLFSREKNFRYIDKPTLDDGGILYVPFQKELDLKKLPVADIFMGHFGINEAVLNNGISIISNIKLSDLRNYPIIFLGHYHKPQEIDNGISKCIYVGSPVQLDWGEVNENKRFIIFDRETKEIEFIPINIPGLGFYKFFIEKPEDVEEVIEKIKMVNENGGGKIKVFSKIKTDDLKCIEDDVVIIDQSALINQARERIGLDVPMREQLRRYLEVKNIPEENTREYLEIAETLIEKQKTFLG